MSRTATASGKKKEKETKFRKIPALSILSGQTSVVRAKATEHNKDHIVQEKVEVRKNYIFC